ncbi:hypothetical protein D9619_005948 [Psilocybe cf. subviscida]|uniref:TAP42-like protein n=1 Tax=Psilocybe cf. subviscida TaxID=2480587 RepID=A0A8H5BWJ8_9AGAR|nr:hypothetical protein D9619_005948 [Psilocybe cf. subviscida]
MAGDPSSSYNTMSLPLSALLKRVLSNVSLASNLPAIDDETQELVSGCLSDLQKLHSQIVELGTFSPNETLDDISTRDLVYLVVPYLLSEAQGRVKATNRTERLESLIKAENYVKSFILLLEKYEVIPADERALYDVKATKVADFAKRRELKINQFKKEKDLRVRVEMIRKRTEQKPVTLDLSNNYDLIASLIPSSSSRASNSEEDLDSQTDEILRETTLLVLRLLYAHSSTQLQSMEQELDLLRNAPASPTMGPEDQEAQDPRDRKRKEEENDWKLDKPALGGPDGKGPLMDAYGKPLRPFTILPSDAGERARLQKEVFGPGYRLPTMSIDEYLQIEQERGGIIEGGGPSSEGQPTSSEKLAIDAEMDGTLEGEERAEFKRQKDENWAVYTEENPRGAGNRMNRG